MKSRDRVHLADARCVLDGEDLPVANLSLGGFFVATERPLLAGQIVALRLKVGGRDLPIFGKVAWVNGVDAPQHAELPPGFGVSITRIDLADKVALVEILRQASRRPRSPGRAS